MGILFLRMLCPITKKCNMIANETTPFMRPNDTENNKYRSPYSLQ